MAPRALYALAFVASTALALPASQQFTFKKALGPLEDDCAPDNGDGQPYVTRIGFYSEHDCNDRIGGVCVYTYQDVVDGGEGNYGCNPGLLPDTTPFYAKTEDAAFEDMQIVFTRDQTCPPNGPGAVFTSLVDNGSCVIFNLGGEDPGISIYPHGGSIISRKKRDDPKCDGFVIESQTPSESETVQVSNIVDCTNGGTTGCQITVGQEHTESVSTSMELSVGGGIEGLFEIGATFGMEYTESSTTSEQEGFSVEPGQKGYLAAYSSATLFKGKFTGCDTGDEEQEGQVLAIKEQGFTYSVVYTGA